VARHANYALGPRMCIQCTAHLVTFAVTLRQLQREDDNCVGNECSNIKAELMRRGERLPEQLIDHIVTFYDSKYKAIFITTKPAWVLSMHTLSLSVPKRGSSTDKKLTLAVHID